MELHWQIQHSYGNIGWKGPPVASYPASHLEQGHHQDGISWPHLCLAKPCKPPGGKLHGPAGQRHVSHSAICNHFPSPHHLGPPRRVWHRHLRSCPFPVTTGCYVSSDSPICPTRQAQPPQPKLTPLNSSSQAMQSETLTIFLTLQMTLPVSKQPSWTGKAPKLNRVVQVTPSRGGEYQLLLVIPLLQVLEACS